MAVCRVYLFTYRRNHLLPRALDSLRKQTVTDWVCELHNDDPSDPFPRQFAESLNDVRIAVVDHPRNLGPTKSFNLAFQAVSEPFISLLEDDNWWEPQFLETMLRSMEMHPGVHVVWANMRIWLEEPDGSWTDVGKNTWDRPATGSSELVPWGQPRQIKGACHSNGAMMLRSSLAARYVVPADTMFALMETARERVFPHPLLFIPSVCANFAVTRSTSRSDSRVLWAQSQILLIASFFKHAARPEEFVRDFWAEARVKPVSVPSVFFAALVCGECRFLLREARFLDWTYFGAFCLKHPILAFKSFQAIRALSQVWNFLDVATRERTKEAMES